MKTKKKTSKKLLITLFVIFGSLVAGTISESNPALGTVIKNAVEVVSQTVVQILPDSI